MRVSDKLRNQAQNDELVEGTMGKTLFVRNVIIWLGTNSYSHRESVITSFPEKMIVDGGGGDDGSYSHAYSTFLMIYCVHRYRPVLHQNLKTTPPDGYATCVVCYVFC